ncbi:MAG: hypothetical protein CMH60_05955 [Myxococcales bacterium]|nr:hypothetical protein [Myxococcales bacterium]|tara:strand:- start:99 stop:1412 length:1314 start_codon:yes stop_codon:yes gene_type:complete
MSNAGALPGAEPDFQDLARTALNSIFVLIKTIQVYEPDNSVFERPMQAFCDSVNKLLEEKPKVEFRVIGQLVYINKVFVRIDSNMHENLKGLLDVFEELQINELVFKEAIQSENIMNFLLEIRKYLQEEEHEGSFRSKEFEGMSTGMIELEDDNEKRIEMSDSMRALRAYLSALLTLKAMIKGAETGKKVWLAPVKGAIQDLVTHVYANDAMMLGIAQLPHYRHKHFNRLVNTAILVIAMCRQLGADKISAAKMALSAAVHDLDWSNKGDRKTTMQQLIRIYRGDVIGRERLLTVDLLDDVDGSIPAKFISVASAYERLSALGDDNGPVPGDEILRRIEAGVGTTYDDLAVKILVNVVGLFPVGTTVELSTGEFAVVIEMPEDGRALSAPMVKVIRDASGNAADGRMLDLAEADSPTIKRGVPPGELEVNTASFFLV